MKNCQNLSWKGKQALLLVPLGYDLRDRIYFALLFSTPSNLLLFPAPVMPMTLINELTTDVYGFPTPCLISAQCYVPLTMRSLQSNWRLKFYSEADQRIWVPDDLYSQSFMRLFWAEVLWKVRFGQISFCNGNCRLGQNRGPRGRTAEHGIQGEPRDHSISARHCSQWPRRLYEQRVDSKGLSLWFWAIFGITNTSCPWKMCRML